MPVFLWSDTANSNATIDPSIGWSEGQPPSSVNNSARAMMSAIAEYRDDMTGAIVTGGVSTAYTVSSNSTFDTLAHLNGQIIAFTPHTTNGATVTLDVDGLGAKPLRTSPNVELQSGVLIQGTPYVALYNNSDGAFYLRGVGAAPGIPLGVGMDYWLSTTPSSFFAFPAGQAISRTTYATLFAGMGTTYGSGDGTTTFNLPDKTERVSVMVAATATRLTSTYFGGNSTVLGAVGGSDNHALTVTELPAHTHSNTLSDPGHSHSLNLYGGTGTGTAGGSGNNIPTSVQLFSNSGSSGTGISLTNASIGGSAAHANVQPTIVCNYIMRII